MQQQFWNKRSLTYACHVYSSQLKEGARWGDVKKVYSISMLGGCRERDITWRQEFKKNFKFVGDNGEMFDDQGIERGTKRERRTKEKSLLTIKTRKIPADAL